MEFIDESNVDRRMQDVVLSVSVPESCAVGTAINVEYDGKYYCIEVPEGGPGNTIQVMITCEVGDVPSEQLNGLSIEPAVNVPESAASETGMSKTTMAAGAGVVVVGAIVVGPLLTGAAVVGGAFLMCTSKGKETDEKYKITENVKAGAAAVVTKAKEIDENYKVSENAAKVVRDIDTGVKQLDEKYKLTETAMGVVSQVGAKATEIDGKYKITEQTTAAANSAATKASELNDKYQVTNTVKSATMSGLSSMASAWSSFKNRASGPATSAPATAEVVAPTVVVAENVQVGELVGQK